MMDLRDDGSIAIDFEVPADEGGTEMRPWPVLIKAPPTFGAYKRLRAEIETLNAKVAEQAKVWQDDETIDVAQYTTMRSAATEDSALAWWKFAINGDESFRGLGTPPAPDDCDTWPMYLSTNASINEALSHWKTVPLARGGQRVTTPR